MFSSEQMFLRIITRERKRICVARAIWIRVLPGASYFQNQRQAGLELALAHRGEDATPLRHGLFDRRQHPRYLAGRSALSAISDAARFLKKIRYKKMLNFPKCFSKNPSLSSVPVGKNSWISAVACHCKGWRICMQRFWARTYVGHGWVLFIYQADVCWSKWHWRTRAWGSAVNSPK